MLLDRVNKEDNVRVDEVDVKFPMKSTDTVCMTHAHHPMPVP